MPTVPELRDYQVEAIAAAHAAVARGVRRFVVELPTGTGKTVTFVTWTAEALDAGERVLVIVHTDELIGQTVRAFREHRPELTIGIVKGEENDHAAPLVVASVQTLARSSRLVGIAPDFAHVVIDEAHHAAADTWQRVVAHFAKSDPIISGWTATAFRADASALIGETGVFQEVAFTKPIRPMIEGGYLCDVAGKSYRMAYDLDGVRSTAGDYSARGLADAMRGANVAPLIVEAYARELTGKRAIAYLPTVDAAAEVADLACRVGVPAEMVEAKTPTEQRRATLARLRTGETLLVANAMLLTEGFDEPRVEGILLARPTKSPVLFRQIIGRGLRTYPGKQRCLVLDFHGATRRNDLVSLSKVIGVDMRDGESARAAIVRHEVEAQHAAATAAERARLVEEAVDLFRQSAPQWVADPDGGLFTVWIGAMMGNLDVATADAMPDADAETWSVYLVPPRQPRANRGGFRFWVQPPELCLVDGYTLDAAQRFAESYARGRGAGRLIGRAENTAPAASQPIGERWRKTFKQPAVPVGLTVAQANHALALHYGRQRALTRTKGARSA